MMRILRRVFLSWLAFTLVGAVAIFMMNRLPDGPMPSDEAQSWAIAYLHAARLGEPRPQAPESAASFEGEGPIIFSLWASGEMREQVVAQGTLVEAVEEAAEAFLVSDVARSEFWSQALEDAARPYFTLSVVHGEGPVLLGVPFLTQLWLVPLRDGVVFRLDGSETWLGPEQLREERLYDRAVPVPIPDLSFGLDIEGLIDRMARDTGRGFSEMLERGEVRRFRAGLISETDYPRSVPVTEATLREAAVDGAEFLLMHQERSGRYTYIYEGQSGGPGSAPYNLPRHSGTTYFLAQVARLSEMPTARQGAIRALRWVRRVHGRPCGGPDRLCIAQGGKADVGSAALTAVAAAEVLAGGPDGEVRQLLEGLMGFLRGQQRDDGELMHEYDLQAQEPIDIQHMYYSGEAALAFFRAHRVLGDERDLEAGRRVMNHLTGAGWDFFGSRYFYGEEHWTCIAAGEAYDRVPLESALDFCLRWAEWNEALQFDAEETPWPVAGMYGVGPLVVPRLTPVGSRSEAFISTYEMARLAGVDTARPRRLVERGLAALLRWSWNPGPVHLLYRPTEARGGVPGSPVDLDVRNDFVQHAGSAIIRWAEILREEGNRIDASD